MKVTVATPEESGSLTLGNMEAGGFCKDRDGNIYFCTTYTAACLNDHGQSLQHRTVANNTPVTRIRSGSTITIITD